MKLAIVVVLVACSGKAKPPKRDDAGVRAADAGAGDAATSAWPELANLPTVEPVRVIALPARPDVPRFTVGGPVLAGDVAIVSSSQFGFIAVDFRRGQIAWSKPAGAHVAPPQLLDGNAVLLGDCLNEPHVADGETLLACMRVVTPTGADVAYLAVHGKTKAVADFAASAGEQHLDKTETGLVWRRGDHAVAIDPMTGVATPAPAIEPPLVVTYKDKTWRIRRGDDGVISAEGKPAWHSEPNHDTLLGAVNIPQQSPLVRVSRAVRHRERPELLLFDVDATGSLNWQVSTSPAPGIGLIGHAIDPVGDVALAVRLDTSLERDYIAAYAANARLLWTYQLPRMPRPDPVGIAIANDAVVVFHDGDTFTVLPELSAPPTAPAAVKAPSENATP
ncbi:MAG TPA: hypothetical protein VIV40_07105 [Kofleriaceae bacterium]